MDRHPDPLLRHSPDDGKQADNEAYLRQLKTQSADDIAGSSSAAEASAGAGIPQASTDQPAPVLQERRRSPRFLCSGSVELFAEGSRVPLHGMLGDISLHGCYTEMSTTLPVNTKLALVVEALGFRVRTLATVRVCYPFLGMGICFAEMEPPEREHLEQILAALAGQRAAARGISRPTGSAES